MGNRRIKFLEVYWKVDRKNQIILTYCSNSKIITFGKHNPKFIPRQNFSLRTDIDFIYDSNIRRPALKFKNIACMNCQQLTIDAKFIKIKNDWIYQYYDKRVGVLKKGDDKDIADGLEDELDSALDTLSTKIKDNLIEDYWTVDQKLPLYFRKKYDINRFNKEHEVLFFKDKKFRNYKESLVCIDCYLKIVGYLQRGVHHGTNIYETELQKRNQAGLLKMRVKGIKSILSERRMQKQTRGYDSSTARSNKKESIISLKKTNNFLSTKPSNQFNTEYSGSNLDRAKSTSMITSDGAPMNRNKDVLRLTSPRIKNLKGIYTWRPKSSFRAPANTRGRIKLLKSDFCEIEDEIREQL